MDTGSTQEFFRNIKNIPDKGSREYAAFFANELDKITYGVTINGVFIHGWLYWHWNHWNINKDIQDPRNGDIIRSFGPPDMRDNEWIMADAIKKAEEEKKGLMIFGSRRLGKDLLNSSKLYCDGYEKTIGEAKVGDRIFDESGSLTEITEVLPQGKQPIYKITLLDGREIFCGLQHNHIVYKKGIINPIVLTTQNLLKDYTHKRVHNGYKDKIARTINETIYSIPACSPVKYNKKNLLIDPYVLGLWLGDGSSYRSSFHSVDSEIIEYLKNYAASNNLNFTKLHNIEYSITGINSNKWKNTNTLSQSLKHYNLIKNKHIPTEYLHSSVEDRLELLRGLMDSDGYCSKAGVMTFSSSIENLSRDFSSLCRSLGIIIRTVPKQAKLKGVNKKISYISRLYTELPVFKLSRKLRLMSIGNRGMQAKIKKTSIIKIEYVFDAESTCIMVANKSKCFLTDNYTVTHNSVAESSWIGRGAVIYQGSENVISSTNSEDLNIVTSLIDNGMNSLHPYFKHGRIKNDWGKQVVFGIKDKKGEELVYSKIAIRNLNDGLKTEAFAGLTPKTLIIDEIGKANWGAAFESAKPSFTSPFGWRCVPILTGCVCAGTKVWNNNGILVKIEDLNPKDGILGFDIVNQQISKENITYWQPPFKKPCYKITTKLGRELECSDDHPILFRSRNELYGDRKNRKRKIYFKEAKYFKKGEQIAIAESINIFGKLEMWQPRFIGMLIGDGSYGKDKTPILSNCDKELNDFIDNNFDTVIEKSYITKEGKLYRETRLKGICKNLKELGIYGQTKNKKTLPKFIDTYDYNSITELLGGLFDTDGCIHISKNNTIIKLTAAHKSILEEVKYLLHKIGIHSSIAFKKPNLKNPIDKNGWYDLLIADRKSLLFFIKNIKLLVEYKRNKLYEIETILKNKKNKIPKETTNLRFETIKSVEYIGVNEVYNLTAGNTNTYIANGIVTHNTGGTLKSNSDAEKYFTHPESHNFLAIEMPNKKNKYGLFISGLKRMEGKKQITLGNYLETRHGILVPDTSEIANMPFFDTDEEKAKAKIQEELDAAIKDKDPKAYLKQRMYFPEDPDDCFLTDDGNDFPVDAIKDHLTYLETLDNNGEDVILARMPSGGITYKPAPIGRKRITEFPVTKESFKDAPIVIYEHPIDNPPRGLYSSGADPYNQNVSTNSESLGTVYIYKRMYDAAGDGAQDMMVASYAARPNTMKEWHENVEMLLEYYNAICMPENEGGTFIQYFDQKNKGHMLADGYNLAKQINQKSSIQGRTKGLPATTPVKNFYMNLEVEYTKDQIQTGENPETHEPILKMGLVRILDTMLLKEMLSFRKGSGNYDRIVAFGHTLACNVYMNKMYPVIKLEQEETKKPQIKPPRSPFILTPSNPFSGRKSSLSR